MAKKSQADSSATPEPEELTFPVDPSITLTPTQKTLQMQAKLAKILGLAIGGGSVREISVQMEKTGWTGVSRSHVGKLLKQALDKGAKDLNFKAGDHILLELEKMRTVELAHFNRLLRAVDADDIEKLTRALDRVWKRRDTLLGLAKPQKHEHTGEDGTPIQTEAKIHVILPSKPEVDEGDNED